MIDYISLSYSLSLPLTWLCHGLDGSGGRASGGGPGGAYKELKLHNFIKLDQRAPPPLVGTRTWYLFGRPWRQWRHVRFWRGEGRFVLWRGAAGKIWGSTHVPHAGDRWLGRWRSRGQRWSARIWCYRRSGKSKVQSNIDIGIEKDSVVRSFS